MPFKVTVTPPEQLTEMESICVAREGAGGAALVPRPAASPGLTAASEKSRLAISKTALSPQRIRDCFICISSIDHPAFGALRSPGSRAPADKKKTGHHSWPVAPLARRGPGAQVTVHVSSPHTMQLSQPPGTAGMGVKLVGASRLLARDARFA